jgi:hypothetical protein
MNAEAEASSSRHRPGNTTGPLPGRRVLPALCLAVALAASPAPAAIILEAGPDAGETESDEPNPDNGPANPQAERIEFLNGDLLHGALGWIDPTGGVRWNHPAVRQPIDFNLDSVANVRLEPPNPSTPRPKQNSSVQFTNGDEMLGQIVSLDADTLVLDTWYAGPLQIPRQMVRSLHPNRGHSSAIYEGPTTIDDWKRGNVGRRDSQGEWQYSNGALVSFGRGSIGRDFELPDLLSMDFELSWTGYLQLMMALYTDNLESFGGNTYSLQINGSSVFLQRMTQGRGSSSIGTSEVPGLQQKNRVRVGLRISRPQKSISLLIDGTLAKRWTDPADFAGKGNGIVFFHQGQGAVRINDLRLTEWDGKLEDDSVTEVTPKEDLVRLLNNDKMSGQLESLRDGAVQFTTAFASMEVPLERVDQITLSSETASQATPTPGDIRATFAGKGSITFQLERWDDQRAVGQSPNFGSARFDPAAFSLIQFNLDQPRVRSDAALFDADLPESIPAFE